MMEGSTTRGGNTVAETIVGVFGHGTPMIAGFMDEVVAWHGRRPGDVVRLGLLLSISRAGRRPAGCLPDNHRKTIAPLEYERFRAIAN